MLLMLSTSTSTLKLTSTAGTQFGMLILYMKTAYPDALTNPPNISDLGKLYTAAKKAFDADEDNFKDTARRTVVKLQSGDEECRK